MVAMGGTVEEHRPTLLPQLGTLVDELLGDEARHGDERLAESIAHVPVLVAAAGAKVDHPLGAGVDAGRVVAAREVEEAVLVQRPHQPLDLGPLHVEVDPEPSVAPLLSHLVYMAGMPAGRDGGDVEPIEAAAHA